MATIQLNPVLGGLAFVVFGVSICFFVSSKWRAFAARYPVQTRPNGEPYTSRETHFGGFSGSHYPPGVQVVLSDVGIYFSMPRLLRLFHPPFLVPWGRVRHVEKKSAFGETWYYVAVKDSEGSVYVSLPEKAENELSRYCRLA